MLIASWLKRFREAVQEVSEEKKQPTLLDHHLLKEIARTEEKLRAADFDPEIIRTIRHQIEKVTEAGGIPEKKESVIGRRSG